MIARLGGVTAGEIAAILGHDVDVQDRGEIAAPGTLEAHYAPTAHVHVITTAEVGARATSLLATGARVALLALDPPGFLPPDSSC